MKKLKKITLNFCEIQTGDIVLFHTKFNPIQPISWLAAFIRFFERNYWNHAAIVYKTDLNTLFLVEALAGGVAIDYLSGRVFEQDIKILRLKSEFLQNPYYKNCIADRIHKGIGTRYDFSGCLIFQLFKQCGEVLSPDLKLWFGRKGSRAANRFYCSEFVAWCLDLPKWWELAPDDVDKSKLLKTIIVGNVEHFDSLKLENKN
jgi:hypothetical protein